MQDIVDTLGEAIAPATRNALDLLNDKGALLDGPQPARTDGPPSDAAIFTAALGGNSPAEALAALAGGRIAVTGSNTAAMEIVRLLEATGLVGERALDLEDPAGRPDLLIAAPGPDELEHLFSINERCLQLDAPWLQVLPNDGRMVAIGPLFVPGVSGCHVCYRIRRGACSGFEDVFERVETVPPKAGSPPPVVAIAAGIAVTLALRWLAAGDPTLPGRFYTLETGVVLGLGYHQLLRVPRCPACGAGDAPMPTPWFNEKARDD